MKKFHQTNAQAVLQILMGTPNCPLKYIITAFFEDCVMSEKKSASTHTCRPPMVQKIRGFFKLKFEVQLKTQAEIKNLKNV